MKSAEIEVKALTGEFEARGVAGAQGEASVVKRFGATLKIAP